MSEKINFKTGYSFNSSTGELMGQETVWLEKKTGEYPHAANVTFKLPPACGENETAIYDRATDSWSKVPDHRGSVWYNPDGTPGGIITRLGEVSEILKEPPEPKEFMVIVWDYNKKDWKHEPAEGYVAEGDKVREMTPVERIEAGLDKLPERYKIKDGKLVEKMYDELLAEGKITLNEYNEHQRQMREGTYMSTTDKIGLMVLRGEATMEEWQAAIQAVKEKWPYKE